MIDVESGLITVVDTRPVGSPVTVLAPAGTSLLTVEDNVDFSPGEEILVTPESGDPEYYVIADVDPETGITVNTPLSVDYPEGTWIATSPLQVETVAMVRLVDSGEVVPCIVLHTLTDALRPGIRDENTAETVLVLTISGTRYVLDVVARQVVRDISAAEKGTPPAAPTGLALDSVAYLDEFKKLQSQITATWDPVTSNSDGSPITDLDGYEVQIHAGGTGGLEPFHQATTTEQDITQTFLRPFPVGSTWTLRVRAIDTSGNKSDWSTEDSITTATDDLPPSTPSTPVATTRLGTIRVNWDGKNSAGGAMEGDFAYCEVHLGTTSGFTPSAATLISRLTGAGYTVFGPATYGVTYYARLVAVDTSGNVSGASAQTTAVVAPLVDVSNFPDDAMDTLYARTGHFLQLDADNFAANKVQADWCDVGLMTAMIVRGDQIETDSRATYGIKLKNTGFTAYDGSAATFTIDAATGAVTMKGSLTSGSSVTGATVQTTATPNSGIKLTSTGLVAYDVGGSIGFEVSVSGTVIHHKATTFLAGISGNGLFSTSGDMSCSQLSASSIYSYGSLNVDGSAAMNHIGATSITSTAGVTITSGGLAVTGNATFANFVSLSAGITAAGAGHFNTVYADSVPTTAASPNAVMGSSGQLLQNSSSRRWKTSIEELPCDPAVALELIPRRFKSTLDDDNPDQWMVGYIAEEAHDLGLTLWVDYEADGTTPRGFNYATWTVALQAIVRHLAADLSDARDRIAVLEAA